MAKKAMREAAFPCTVVVLRRRGVRIRASELLKTDPSSGFLLCMQEYTHPNWHARLYRDETFDKECLPRLNPARLARENGGVRLYRGNQVEERVDYPQSWLCAPTPERAFEVVLAMLEQERGTL